MKKGLLLSIVASTVLFAGGDIAPVEPVAEAPAAACNDFYGHAGVGAILGVSKEIFSGLTVNAEVQGAAGEVYDVNTEETTSLRNRANLTQLNLGYSFANTAIKVGRFTLDMALSPLVFTDTDSLGLKIDSYDGVMFANTDIPDTVVYGAYVYRQASHVDADRYRDRTIGTIEKYPMGSEDGVVALGFQSKALANTTISGIGYYAITSDDYALAGSVKHKFGDTTVVLGGAYEDVNDVTAYLVGGYVTQHFGAFDATLAATYQDGDVDGGKATYVNNYGDLTWKTYQANENGTWAVGAKLSTTVSGFNVWATVGYNENKDYQLQAGINKTVKGINLSTDIRYRYEDATDLAYTRVRARAIYKF